MRNIASLISNKLLLLLSGFVLILCFDSCHTSSNSRDVSFTEFHPFDKSDSSELEVLHIEDIVENKEKAIKYDTVLCRAKYIPLETIPESILPDIAYCFCTEDYLYLCTDFVGNDIHIFDWNGHFVRAIRAGRGPGELIHFHGAAFSKDINELIALSSTNRLSFYEPDGKFIRDIELPFHAYNFSVTEDGFVFVVGQWSLPEYTGNHDNVIIVTDLELNETFKSNPYPIYGYTSHPTLYHSDRITSCFIPLSEEVMGFKDGKLKSLIYFDCGRFAIPYEELTGLHVDEMTRFYNDNPYCNFRSECFFTDSHIYFACSHETWAVYGFLDRHSDSLFGSATFGSFIPFQFPLGVYSDHFVTLVDANKVTSFVKKAKAGQEYDDALINSETLSLLERVQEDDNPVLMLYDLKQF